MTGTENTRRQKQAFIDGREKFRQYQDQRLALAQYRLGEPTGKVLPFKASRAGWLMTAALKTVRNFFSRRNG